MVIAVSINFLATFSYIFENVNKIITSRKFDITQNTCSHFYKFMRNHIKNPTFLCQMHSKLLDLVKGI